MCRPRVIWLGIGLLMLGGWRPVDAQDAPPLQPPAAQPAPAAEPVPEPEPAPAADEPKQVKPLFEGPLHEAFLSPARAGEPPRVAKPPPRPITERPGVDRPGADAQWIEGYWDWDPKRDEYVWVTGTWRVAPPGRFWVNGYWKRDDQGWYRVPGFWSDRQTDRIDYRKEGPPPRPAEDVGPAPGEEFFYVPGQWYPDQDGVVWKKGFWAKAQPGWAWVPAQWIKQPEGWVFQEGYWDRTLEDRGTLFSPAQAPTGQNSGELVYQPFQQIAPESYGRLYGAFGRPTPYYDGYPGCYYGPDGRYYGYANYGNIGLYTGYLDYPFGNYFGYPYMAVPNGYSLAGYGSPYGLGLGTALGYGLGYGYGGYGGLGYGSLIGRLGLLQLGFGYPFFGYGGGFPFLSGIGGFGGYGYPYSGIGFGFPYGGIYGPGYGGYGLGGYGLGYGGYGGYGLGGYGLGYGGYGYPYYGGYGYGYGYPYYGYGSGFGYGYPTSAATYAAPNVGVNYSAAYVAPTGSAANTMAPPQGRYLGIDEEPTALAEGRRGMKVTNVYPGTPAQRSGLQVGDVLLSINGYLTEQRGNLAWIIANAAPNNQLRITLKRPGEAQQQTITATLP